MDYRNEPLVRYLEDASAAKPTPGGGSVAAVAAALASTMASMAANFTLGKEKFRAVEADIRAALARLADVRAALLDMAHQDMAAYEAVMAAYRLPKSTDAERTARAEAVRRATRASLDLVLRVLGAARDVARDCRRLADIANPNLLSDVGVAAELALGAARASRINAAVNLSGYSGDDAAAARAQADEILADAERLVAETREIVVKHLGG